MAVHLEQHTFETAFDPPNIAIPFQPGLIEHHFEILAMPFSVRKLFRSKQPSKALPEKQSSEASLEKQTNKASQGKQTTKALPEKQTSKTLPDKQTSTGLPEEQTSNASPEKQTSNALLENQASKPLPAPETYKYEPLNGQRDIRLLYLAPGSGEDEVSCDLFHVSLDRLPNYEAISYVWGDPSIKKEIRCGEGKVSVTLNLYSALRHLRYANGYHTLWADALCKCHACRYMRYGC